MSLYEALLVMHLVGAFWMAAGAGIVTIATMLSGRAVDRSSQAITARAIRLGVLWGVVPGSLLAIVFGSWLVSEAGYDFGAIWVSLSYVLWLALLAIATGVISPRARRQERLALAAMAVPREAAGSGAPAGTQIGLTLVVDLLLVVFLFLMVLRPGA
ncbi:MAG: DUF2269 family protein [Dehalococcoidia bacterium]